MGGDPSREAEKAVVFVRAYYTVVPDAVSQTISELAGGLAADRRVAVICLSDGGSDVSDGVEIWGVPTFGLPAEIGSKARPLLEIWFLAAAIVKAVLSGREVRCLVTVDTPSGIGLAGTALKWVSRGAAKHVCWVLDIYEDQATDLGHKGRYQVIRPARRALNDMPYRYCDATVTIGECMRARLESKDANRTVVIPQWQDGRKIEPRDGAVSKRQFGVDGATVALYSGHATYRHPLDGALEAAERLADSRPDVLFVFAGDSDGLLTVEAEAHKRSLHNVLRWDRVPLAQVSDLLGVGDVHLVSLAPAATGTCVPSKVYAAMAACRPTIFLGDPSSQVALDLREAGAGYVLEPSDAEGIARVLAQLRDHPEEGSELGLRGNRFFREHRSLPGGIQAWKGLLRRLERAS